MKHFNIVFRTKGVRYCVKGVASQVPNVGESYFLPDGWYKDGAKPTDGKYKRVTDVRWKSTSLKDYIYSPAVAHVYLQFAESYEPENYTG